MLQFEHIEAALRGELDREWRQTLDQWEDAPPAQSKAVMAYASGLRNRIIRSVEDIDDPAELERAIATQYIEMKCHWTMLNIQSQHQLHKHETVAPDILYRATCVSRIIQAMEPLLNQGDVEDLTEFLASPIQ